jgi:hypothetical protein
MSEKMIKIPKYWTQCCNATKLSNLAMAIGDSLFFKPNYIIG